MTALYSDDDYGAALASLRPRGRAWPEEAGSQQVQLLRACAPSYTRLDAAAQALLVDAFPATTAGLLNEWEISLGLPDPCVGPGASAGQRQAQVTARFAAVGGQSAQTFIDYAGSLGFTIGVELYAPFRCGADGCGDPLGGPEWSFAWGVRIDGPSAEFANQVLLCELQAMKPAETVVFIVGQLAPAPSYLATEGGAGLMTEDGALLSAIG